MKDMLYIVLVVFVLFTALLFIWVCIEKKKMIRKIDNGELLYDENVRSKYAKIIKRINFALWVINMFLIIIGMIITFIIDFELLISFRINLIIWLCSIIFFKNNNFMRNFVNKFNGSLVLLGVLLSIMYQMCCFLGY